MLCGKRGEQRNPVAENGLQIAPGTGTAKWGGGLISKNMVVSYFKLHNKTRRMSRCLCEEKVAIVVTIRGTASTIPEDGKER